MNPERYLLNGQLLDIANRAQLAYRHYRYTIDCLHNGHGNVEPPTRLR